MLTIKQRGVAYGADADATTFVGDPRAEGGAFIAIEPEEAKFDQLVAAQIFLKFREERRRESPLAELEGRLERLAEAAEVRALRASKGEVIHRAATFVEKGRVARTFGLSGALPPHRRGHNRCEAFSKGCEGPEVKCAYIYRMNEPPAATLVTEPSFPISSQAGAGAWRYRSARRSRGVLWAAMLFSAGVHVLVLFGFNRHAPPKKVVVEEERMVVFLEMPDLKELEEPVPEPFDGETPVDTGLSVPTLADVPAHVDLSTAFVQEIDYNSLMPKQDLTAAKTLAIPTNINRSGNLAQAMGKVFDLKDLDRAPSPLVSVAPVVPPSANEPGLHVEISVAFVVDAEGKCVSAYIAKSTDRRLEDAALLAISKWKFRPGIKNGRKVNVRMMQPFVIKMED